MCSLFYFFIFFFLFKIYFSTGIEPMALCMLSKYYNTELYCQSPFKVSVRDELIK